MRLPRPRAQVRFLAGSIVSGGVDGGPAVRTDVTDTLATRLLLTRHQEVPAGAGSAEWFTSIEREAREAGPWEPIDLKVDGRHTAFLQLKADDHWVAFADLGEAWLYIHSLGTSPKSLELVRTFGLPSQLG